MNIKIKKLHPDAVVPTYGSSGAACFDLYAKENIEFYGRIKVSTGLAFEIPEGHVMMIYSRSSHGLAGVKLANSVGVVDSDYRGEVKIVLELSSDGDSVHFTKGDRIAQAMVIPVHQVQFELVNELSDTVRGSGGFGSTGR